MLHTIVDLDSQFEQIERIKRLNPHFKDWSSFQVVNYALNDLELELKRG